MSKTHVIDGVTYVEVDRKAEVGDKILITKFDEESVREVRKVERVSSFKGDFYIDKPIRGEAYLDVAYDEYFVLEPVESGEPTQASPQVIDMLANLARRVSSLESQLSDSQRNVERLAQDIERYRHTQRFYNHKTSDVEFTIDMITHDLNVICEKMKKLGGAAK